MGSAGARFVELYDRLAARRHGNLEWQHIVDDLDELSQIETDGTELDDQAAFYGSNKSNGGMVKQQSRKS
jgi:hypothetical protein